ncbi:UNVERIFIED_CONTAM: hypothetical protein GPA08_22195 [Serratia marcescens]
MKVSFKFIILIVLGFSSLNSAYADGVEVLSALFIIDSLKSNGYLEHAEVLSDIVDVRKKTCAEKVDYDAAE